MFASGNAASLSSFDPLWVRSFVTVFSPFTMAILIVMKLLIPILLVLCAFCVVIVKIRIAPRDVFLTMTLFSDVMVLIFFFQIRNEGSWKDIGLSLSRFIIAEVMTICLMVLHLVARVLVSYDLCWVIEPCVFKFRSYFEKRCHQL